MLVLAILWRNDGSVRKYVEEGHGTAYAVASDDVLFSELATNAKAARDANLF